jgi:hypothetical protein
MRLGIRAAKALSGARLMDECAVLFKRPVFGFSGLASALPPDVAADHAEVRAAGAECGGEIENRPACT